MRGLFYPKNVAIVGISPRPENLARNILGNLEEWGFGGEIYCVNPKGGELDGRPLYKSLEEIPGPVDLAAVLTPAAVVPGVVAQAAAKGIKWLTISSGGFTELDEKGDRLIREIGSLARGARIRFVGPNGLGIANAENGLVLPFTRIKPHAPGPVSVIAQSGGVGLSILLMLYKEGLGFAKFVSVGNKADMDEVDYLEYLGLDPKTKVIILYLESVDRGREFARAASRIEKPILVFKANTGGVSAGVARSHTAALSNDDDVFDAAMNRAGVVRVRRFSLLGVMAKTFLSPPLKGNGLGVVSPTGGYAVMAADLAQKHGFIFPRLDEKTARAVKKRARAGIIRLSNPLDLGDALDAGIILDSMDRILARKNVDAGLLILFRRPDPKAYEGPLKNLGKDMIPALDPVYKRHKKPFSLVLITSETYMERVREEMSYPSFPNLDDAFEVLARFRAFCAAKKTPFETRMAKPGFSLKQFQGMIAAHQPPSGSSREPRFVNAADALALTRSLGFPTPLFEVCSTMKQALETAERIGYPVAMKAISERILHKTDSGGVVLNVETRAQLKQGYQKLKIILSEALDEPDGGIMVQEMVSGGLETIIGFRRDPSFGPVVSLGFGGIWVEILGDVSLGLAPLDLDEVEKMTRALKGYPLLRGARGSEPGDIRALTRCAVLLSRAAVSLPQIQEMEINPLMILKNGHGAAAVDARVAILPRKG